MTSQARDFVVLGGETGQGLGPEAGEFADGLVSAGQAVPERGDLGLESVDLGITGVGKVTGPADGGQSGFELLAEVGVGALP